MITSFFHCDLYHSFVSRYCRLLIRLCLLPLFVIQAGTLVACSKQADFDVSSLVLREMAPGREVAVGYLSIKNLSDQTLRLNYVHSPRADRIEVHQHLYNEGQMQMREIKHLSIAPNSQLNFTPGGHHLMLFGVYERFEQGQQVPLTFEFENQPPLVVVATVKRM